MIQLNRNFMKMKGLLIILVFSICFYAKAQKILSQNSYSNDSLILKAAKLKRLYMLSTASNNDTRNSYNQQFFDEFPKTFEQFSELYGDDSDIHHKPALLIGQAHQHIIQFFKLKTRNTSKYYEKIVSIAIGGKWDADAVNFFQEGLRNKVLDNPVLIINVLAHMSNDKIRSFWYFYFDEPYPEKKLPEQLLKIKSINFRIFTLMIEAQSQVLKYWKE
jgi:hypothetical protein